MGQRCSDTRRQFHRCQSSSINLIGGVENRWSERDRRPSPDLAVCRGRKREGAMEELGLRQREEDLGKPIIMHQSISFILADMATKIEAARLLTLSAASALDSGERAGEGGGGSQPICAWR